jgi:hypothetical protein
LSKQRLSSSSPDEWIEDGDFREVLPASCVKGQGLGLQCLPPIRQRWLEVSVKIALDCSAKALGILAGRRRSTLCGVTSEILKRSARLGKAGPEVLMHQLSAEP